MFITARFKRPLTPALVVAAAAAALLVPTAAASAKQTECANAHNEPTAQTIATTEDSVNCLINVERLAHGLRPVTHDGVLGKAAREFADDMVKRQYFSHVTPTGGTLTDRMHAVRYGATDNSWSAGEIIGWGDGSLGTPEGVVNAWMHSPPHRSIILDPKFTQYGAGAATGSPGITVDLAAATYAVEFGQVSRVGRS
jgi:uncharacterized protein YkwD